MSFLKSKHKIKLCPKAGRAIPSTREHRWLLWLSPFVGLAALVWFLVRVIPKPSRAAYPCQRVAFPLASGFIVWLLGIIGSVTAYRKAKSALARARYVLAGTCIIISIGFIFSAMNSTEPKIAYSQEQFTADSPIGEGKGIHPGRVAWIHDPNATTWNGYGPPYWYDDTCTDQSVVTEMLSKAIRSLTDKGSDADAWDAIFKNFNQRIGRGYVGYTPGEKIAIKINFVLMYSVNNGVKPSGFWGNRHNQIDNSPQLAMALLKQLIDVAGVSPGDISIGDPSQGMPNYWYDMVEEQCPGVVYLTKPGYALYGRTTVTFDYGAPFYWSDPDPDHWTSVTKQDYIPTHFAQADYFINFPILKGHEHAGITLGGKNHYGSLRIPTASGYYDMHWSRVLPSESPGMGRYRATVDLLGHPKLGGKTLLTLIDGLYAGQSWDAVPVKWKMSPFNNDWPSSIFLSQDRIAIDSVAFDFLYNEWPTHPHMSGAHDYLHEAALIPEPPSGVNYDPNNDGGLTKSLGVHEHWNNAIDKQYSRNLDPINGTGIEMVTEPSLIGDFYRDGIVNFKDFAVLAAAWASRPGDVNWEDACDISMPSDGVIDENDLAVFLEDWLK